MDTTQLVTADDLELFAKRRDSEAVIPELVNRLVNESPRITACRIPYGDAINQPGWDGLVESENGFRQFVPTGKSYWEIGTGAKPQTKATSDFKKRTDKASLEDITDATYVFVTPSYRPWPEPKQTLWKSKRKAKGWKELRIIDAVQLADWLREYPAIGYWILKKLGLTTRTTGLRMPAEHWETLESISVTGDPLLPPKLFLIGRELACDSLTKLFKGDIRQLILTVETVQDAEDFVAAFLASLDAKDRVLFVNRCVFIQDEETWQAVANLKEPQILIAHPSLDLEFYGEQLHATALRKGHSVILPVTANISNPTAPHHRLFSPSSEQIESVLIEAKYTHQRARELANLGSCRLACLKRNLLGLGDMPVYAAGRNARDLALAELIGRWDGQNSNDIKALETILGKSYGEWIEVIQAEALRPDTPLTQRNNKWKIISRSEAWSALGAHLSDTDITTFVNVALEVLGELDPQVSLRPEQRLTANIKGIVLKHSTSLRKGLAESLALLGARSDALTMCSRGHAQAKAYQCVRQLLSDADTIKWASLDPVLPMLAEASPTAFLDAADVTMQKTPESPFIGLFKLEDPAFFGRTYLCGLLWALEVLAWSADYLPRVTLLLGELAALDPGGQWTNRPSNTLVNIYLPWYPQTCAPIEKRKASIKALLSDHASVGWKLITHLLPSSCETSSGTCMPTWRDFIPRGWSKEVTHHEYVLQVLFFVDQAVDLATHDLGKMAELLSRLDDLPREAVLRLLEYLQSPNVTDLPETDRLPLWETLQDLAHRHRKFSDAKWALPPDALLKIDEAADAVAPNSSLLLNRRLFSSRDIDLYGTEEGSYSDKEERLEKQRVDFVTSLSQQNGIEMVFELAAVVLSPDKVGSALGQSSIDQVDNIILPSFLITAEVWKDSFTRAFVWSRFWKKSWPWVDSLGISTWPTEQQVAFYTRLPFTKDAWLRAEQMLGSHANLYWQQVPVNPWQSKGDTEEATRNLLVHNRPRMALDCLATLVHDKIPFDFDLAFHALLQYDPTLEPPDQMTHYNITELIAWLQSQPDTDLIKLGQVELRYLDLLDHSHGGAPKTLEQRLADDPSFFAEVIRLCYKSDKEDTETPSEDFARLAAISFRLLHRWTTVPGFNLKNGSFSTDSFTAWLAEAKRLATDSGHLHVATIQIGQVLAYSPADPSGLWIHKDIANALNAKDAAEMRHGYTIQRSNMRGAFWHSGGKEELKLAEEYRTKADELDTQGFIRFADSIRELAKQYEGDAKRQAEEPLIPE